VFPALASGTFREEVRCKAEGCLPAPASGDPIQLSLLTVNGPTAEVLLEDFVALGPGEWLLQNAANSSCGRFILAIAKRLGLRTVNVVRRAELVADLQAAGGDVVLLDGEDLPQRVAAATDGAPIRFAIDAVAGEATTRLARCLATDGVVAVYGLMSMQSCRVPADLMFLNNLRLQGFFTPHYERGLPRERWLEIMRDLGEWAADGTLRAKIAATYPLEQVHEAFRHELQSGAARDGKVILLPNG